MIRMAVAGAVAFTVISCSETPTGTDRILASADVVASGRDALLQCASSATETASGTIDVSGGIVAVGDHVIYLPPGAVNRQTLITITVPASPIVEVDIRANDLESFEFRRPVAITISYRRCPTDVMPVDPTAWYIDTRTKKLLERMPGLHEPDARAVTFLTRHLSGYALAE